jgi:hypothetical protein
MGRRGIKESDGGVNSTMIYCKKFYKCHNVPPVQNNTIQIKKPVTPDSSFTCYFPAMGGHSTKAASLIRTWI